MEQEKYDAETAHCDNTSCPCHTGGAIDGSEVRTGECADMSDREDMYSNYDELHRILDEAACQAVDGKGSRRHADGEPFERQKICVMARWLRGNLAAGPLFQAAKKIFESTRLCHDAAIEELYGAIIYIAAAIYLIKEDADGGNQWKV
ncbi:MAG: hypothetical protein JRJ29_00315 [Deltaproteobacteria bacterium]|nr:hypothetical protein [Deltaproteobacteria bacterium]MBW2081610.1 hypothetical protein [Deltaproteobacteria bacterium]